jgi:nucleotide-binding universal stress UspA family protein
VKILFATDGSPNAREATRFLRRFKGDGDIQLVLLSVSSPPDLTIHGKVQNPDWEAQQRDFVRNLHDDLEDQFSGCGSGYLSRLHKTGNAAQEVLRVAKGIQPDLIVMGAVGHSMVHRMLLGSVSDNVATHAKCSVLIVRPREEDEPQREASPRRIAIAYDGSVASNEAVTEMMTVKWDQNVAVDVVTVAPTYDTGHSQLHDLFLGSTTKYVLRHTPCSVGFPGIIEPTPTRE